MQRGEGAGIPVHEVTERDMWRMAWPGSEAPPTVLTLVGRNPEAQNLDELTARGGLLLCLDGVSYAGNMGFSVRTAEVAGATGVVLATPAPIPASMEGSAPQQHAGHAFIPVVEANIEEAIASAKASGHRIVVIEDVGEEDLPTWT